MARSRFPFEGYQFRDIHPLVCIGTASDRYAGWIGQIYPEAWRPKITRRTRRLGGKRFVEEVLPVESVRDYFQHFRTLELDFTFYEPLLDATGRPTRTYRTLETYAGCLGSSDRLILKVPQAVFARKLHRAGGFVENEAYLDSAFFTQRFYEPALTLTGPWLAALIFEQEYQRRNERLEPVDHAEDLDAFFGSLPEDGRYHVELRTPSLWHPAVLDVLEARGVGQVLSHWTWLPSLEHQFNLSGRRCRNREHTYVIRLMTPRGVRYEDAYARAFPFDHLVDGMLDRRMIPDTARILQAAVAQEARAYVVINNRSGGNAPLIAQQLALTFDRLSPDGETDRN